MATNQENIVQTIKDLLAISTTDLTYSNALFALFQDQGITNTEFNGAFIEFLRLTLSSTKTNINDLLAEYAITYFDGNVNSINDLTLGASPFPPFVADPNVFFEDNCEIVLSYYDMEDYLQTLIFV